MVALAGAAVATLPEALFMPGGPAQQGKEMLAAPGSIAPALMLAVGAVVALERLVKTCRGRRQQVTRKTLAMAVQAQPRQSQDRLSTTQVVAVAASIMMAATLALLVLAVQAVGAMALILDQAALALQILVVVVALVVAWVDQVLRADLVLSLFGQRRQQLQRLAPRL